jgi:hypothetical protein
MYRFLLGWYKKFPEYISRALFLTGESYSGRKHFELQVLFYICMCISSNLWPLLLINKNVGHYIPQLTDLLLTHNDKSTGFRFNIKGVAVSAHAVYHRLLELHFFFYESNSIITLNRSEIRFSSLIGISLQPMSTSGPMA